MARNPADKLTEGLSLLLQGFGELEDVLENDFGGDTEDDEYAAAVVAEVLSAIEGLIDTEDYTPKYIASVVSALTDALEELDPDLFSEKDKDDPASKGDDSDDDDEDEDEDDDDEEDEDFDDDEDN